MFRFFSRKKAEQGGVQPPSLPEHGRLPADIEPMAIEHLASLKLDQTVSDDDIAGWFPPRPLENEGYRDFGCFWPGPVVVLDSENKVCSLQSTGDMVVPLAKLRMGDPVQKALDQYPSLALTKEHEYNRHKFRHFTWIDETQSTELFVTERDGSLCRIQFSRLGFDADYRVRMERHKEQDRQRIAEWRARSNKINMWRREADTDRMLDLWAEHQSDDRKKLAKKLKSFNTLKLDEVIDMVGSVNWDDGLAPLFWFIRQKDAPIAALFEIFSISEADYFLDPEKYGDIENRSDEYCLLMEIKSNMESRHYSDRSDFDGISAWDNAPLGKRNAGFMKPFEDLFRRKFPNSCL